MYYILRPAVIEWQNKLLYAHREHKHPDLIALARSWWNCEPLQHPFPPLRFMIDSVGPHLDNYVTGDVFDLYSERLITILDKAGIAFESFPVTLIDRQTRYVLSDRYAIFHLLQRFPAIDQQRSTVSEARLERIVLTEELLVSDLLLVRDQRWSNIALIHNQLKDRFETMSITGCHYIPIEAYGASKRWARLSGKP